LTKSSVQGNDTKVAIVTGGASGLGQGIVAALVERDVQVVIFDLTEVVNHSASANKSNAVQSKVVDVTDENGLMAAVNEVMTEFGKIDILINAAGVIHSKPLLNLMSKTQIRHDYESFKRVMDIDLNSVFLVTSIVAEQMLMKRTRGRIVNISSISAKGQAGQSAYAGAKAGVEAMTKVWAKELGGIGITVNAVAPGFIDTPSTHAALNAEHISTIKRETPIKRLGQVENVVKAVLYAIDNDYVNGSILAVDGGLIA